MVLTFCEGAYCTLDAIGEKEIRRYLMMNFNVFHILMIFFFCAASLLP